MQSRKITVIQTRNQKKSVIMSAATTLAELKADLRQNGIDYNGMTFFEGTSKTELKTDASFLPHDVPYKGQVTNELVFMLTNTNKKIRSGAMSRIEAYNAIKSMGLQEVCVKKFGKNYTQCKTADLIALVQSNGDSKPESASNSDECVDIETMTTISKLVEILENTGAINKDGKDKILDVLWGVAAAPSKEYKPESTSPYSDDEIDDMLVEMGIK